MKPLKAPEEKQIDITVMAGHAYRTVWAERHYLMKLALVPFLVKLICFAVVVVYVTREHVWLTGIVMLPALFLEGWMLSHWARTIMTGTHRWPFRPSGNEKQDIVELTSRSRGIITGALAFVVVNYLYYGYQAIMLNALPAELDPSNPDPRVTIVALVIAITGFLLFRYLWLYIPLAINAPLDKVLKLVEPLKLSLRLIGLWLVCAVPAFLVFQIIGSGFATIGGDGTAGLSAGDQVAFVFIQVVASLVKNILATAGFAYAFMKLLKE